MTFITRLLLLYSAFRPEHAPASRFIFMEELSVKAQCQNIIHA
jgi:hypothetical protein